MITPEVLFFFVCVLFLDQEAFFVSGTMSLRRRRSNSKPLSPQKLLNELESTLNVDDGVNPTSSNSVSLSALEDAMLSLDDPTVRQSESIAHDMFVVRVSSRCISRVWT